MVYEVGNKLLVGRCEWCQIPGLKIPAIKAKIDTGARTSSIHAFNIEPIRRDDGREYVSFDIHPLQGSHEPTIRCIAPILDQRHIMSSNGHREHRYIILTSIKIANQHWDIELSLSNRDPLRFRMLLGRAALNGHVLVDPSITCHQGTHKKKELRALYSGLYDNDGFSPG